MPSVDYVVSVFAAIVSAVSSDTDFLALMPSARIENDDADGWLAAHLRRAPAEWPQLKWRLGNGTDLGMTDDESFELETTGVVANWRNIATQDYIADFVFDNNADQQDALFQRQYIFALKRALDRKGPQIGSPLVGVPPGPYKILRGAETDYNNVSRPRISVVIPVTIYADGNTIL